MLRAVAVLLCMLAVLCCARQVRAAELRLPVTRDNSIVLYPGEFHLNAGAQERIRIKGNQHLVALSFDATPLRGQLVRSAVLVCGKAAEDIAGLTISTIQADWDEHGSNALTSGLPGLDSWAWPGARFPAVTGGNSFSLFCQAKSTVREGAYYWTIHPDLVHANAIGAAYGLTLHEMGCIYSRNPTIWSREARGKEPYLLVTTGGAEPPPEPPALLRVTDPGEREGLRLHLVAPRTGFAYEVSVNSRPLGRWNIPFVDPGREQVVPIRDLGIVPGQALDIAVRTLNRLGQRSDPATLRAMAPSPRVLPEPAVAPLVSEDAGPAGLTVIPVEDKYDAAGRPVGNLPADYTRNNAVFDGGAVRLRAARGEVVGFQVLLYGDGQVGLACDMPGLRTETWRALYVESDAGRIPDPLVPFDRLDLSRSEATPVVVDVFVPFDFVGRSVDGALRVSDGRSLPIHLAVRGFAIPREASFLCEMNSYGLPSTVREFYRLQQVAYDHRVHCNLLHYAHSTAAPGARKCNMDMVLPSGRRMDERRYNDIAPGATRGYWDDFAEAFGPYLTGECFRDGHRGAVPAPGFYLTFHESWPLNVRDYFSGDPDAYEAFRSAPEYAQTFVNIMRDFVTTAQRRGWTRTGFQVYLNNKGSLSDPRKAPWILDEPTEYWDYRALAYYADLTRTGRGSPCSVKVDYRIDISRPQFDRGQLWGKADLWVVNSGAFREYPRLLADRREATGETMWIYGTTNRVEESNRNVLAWVLEAYRGGATGVVPWQTINRDGSALRKADQLGVFIMDESDGEAAVYPSMRLKAYRRAQQDVEYLELLRRKLGLPPAEMREFIDRYVDLDGEHRTSYAADAGTAVYGRLDPEGFRRLREAAAGLLEAGL